MHHAKTTSKTRRGVALATVAALVFTLIEPQVSIARAEPLPDTATRVVAAAGTPAAASDFSSARRYRKHGVRRYHGRRHRADARMFMGMVGGLIGAISAAEARRRHVYYYGDGYDDGAYDAPGYSYYYDDAPSYYYNPPAPGYVPGPVYRPRYRHRGHDGAPIYGGRHFGGPGQPGPRPPGRHITGGPGFGGGGGGPAIGAPRMGAPRMGAPNMGAPRSAPPAPSAPAPRGGDGGSIAR